MATCVVGKVLLLLITVAFIIFHVVVQSIVQFSSVAQSCPTLCDPMNHSTPGLPVHHQLSEFTQTISRVQLFVTLSLTLSGSLLKLMFIESAMPSNCLILCCPLLLLPSFFPSVSIFSICSNRAPSLFISRPE